MSKPPTIWEHAELLGHSRRDFLKFCAWLAAAAGLDSSQVGQVVHALETKPRLPVVWFHFQECTCCSESFIRSSHPIVSDIILDKISLDYTETLQAAAGHQAEAALHETMKKHQGEYLMLVEGSIPTGDDGVYCCIGGRTALDIVPGSGGRRQGHRGVGQLRLERVHPGGQAESHGRHAHPQAHHRQADHQSARLPADRRGDGGHGGAPARVRHDSQARPDRPAEGLLLAARARHLLPPPELRRRPLRGVVGRRERAQGLLPLQDGLPRAHPPTTPAASRGGTAASASRFVQGTAASAAAKRTSGTTGRSTTASPTSRASASSPPPTRSVWPRVSSRPRVSWATPRSRPRARAE